MILRRISWLAFLVFVLFLAPSVSHGGAQPGQVELTAEERQFIADHPVIRVSNEMDWPPFDFAENGKPQGYDIDYLRLLESRLPGLSFEFVNGYAWGELVDMVGDRKIDLLHPTPILAKRREEILFSEQPILEMVLVLVARKDLGVRSYSDMRGKRMAAVEGCNDHELFPLYPDVELVPVKSSQEALEAVAAGRADGYYDSRAATGYIIQKNHITGLDVIAEGSEDAAIKSSNLYIGVRNDWPELLSIVEKGMRSITDLEKLQLGRKWYGDLFPMKDVSPQRDLVLTTEERDFLKAHPTLSVAFDVDWPPVESVGGKKGMQGISAEYLEKIGEMLDVKLTPTKPRPWKEMLTGVEKGKLDMFSAVSPTPQRREWLAFTTPYLKFPQVIVTTENVAYVGGVADLADSMVAVVDGYASHDIMKKSQPESNLLVAPTVKDGLMAVSRGEAFAFVGSLAAVSHVISREGLTGLKVSGETPYSYDISMATRKDDVMLLGLLQKGLDALSQEERSAINSKWMSVTYEHQVDYTLLWQILGAAAVLMALILFWNRRLKSMAMKLRSANEAAEEANKELERRARVDGLTQIANRRWFDEVLHNEWARAIRDNSFLSLIMCDVDFFKGYNDRYGHVAGDECLKAVAAKLNASASRPADLAARYGGEEFVILLPNTDMGGACTLAEAIRQEIEQLGIAHEGSGVSSIVSLSFGVATLLPTKEQLPGDLIEAADKALYQAKENGRNRVEQAESS